MIPTGTILITDDRRGVASELAERLGELGARCHLLDAVPPAEQMADWLATLRRQVGPIAGLIHAAPLGGPLPGESDQERLDREVKGLYLLARGLEDDLRQAGREGAAVLLAATGLGGQMGFAGDLPEGYFAGQGGIAGLVKCIGFEWPEVLVRVVDLDPRQRPDELADLLLLELRDTDGPLEVGNDGTRRVIFQCEPGPLDRTQPPAVELSSDSVILITGGARGVTAKVALALAQRFAPHLVLVGRSSLPEPEPADTAGLTGQAEIKAALMARLQREGRPASPAQVEVAYQRLKQNREILANLEAIRQAGGQLEYHALDVRDAAALTRLIDAVRSKFGRLDGVIHGAGVIEDRLLRDKTPESFDRVVSTKVQSAWTLARVLDPEQTRFCVFFSSIAGRYGNKGQSDYAAANEILSKLACQLDRQWPGRVVSMAWGPWAQVGMVADLEKHLVARGLQLISPESGPQFVIDELLYGQKGTAEVVIAGGTEQAAQPQRAVNAMVGV